MLRPLTCNCLCLLLKTFVVLFHDMCPSGRPEKIFSFFFPVLGQYQQDELDSSDYIVTIQVAGEPFTVQAFKDPSSIWEEVTRNDKGVEVVKLLAETPISLIDGATSTALLMINNPKQLKLLATMWNDWLKGSGVASFTVATGTLSTEFGITLLASLGMTRIWLASNQSIRHPSERRVSVKGNVRDARQRVSRNKALFSTPYAARQAIADLSQGPLLDAPYNEVLQTWILPVIIDEAINGTTQSTILQRYQSAMDETHLTSKTSGNDGVTMSSLHASYAAKMTKAKLAEQDDWTAFFKLMAAKGRGGIMSGMVASLLGSAFPSIAGVANMVADIIPI